MTEPLLKLTNICKSFGSTDVLTDISLEVRPGEVLCLLGDNGAGKSTLIKILAGAVRADAGRIVVNGAPVSISRSSWTTTSASADVIAWLYSGLLRQTQSLSLIHI